MAEPVRPRMCCTCMCFRRAPNKAKPEEDEDASSIVFYRKFSDVWEEDSAEEEIITCSQPLDDRVERAVRLHHGDPSDRHSEYRKYIESLRGNGPVRVAVDSASDVTSWVETPDSGEQTELIGKSRLNQKMRDSRRLLTLPLKEDQYGGADSPTSLESECDELNRHRAADLSFSIDDSISNFMQSRVTMWTAGSGLLAEDSQMFQEEVWSIHSDSAILLRDYLYPNEDWQASLDSFGSDLDLSQEDDGEEDENGNADESTKILKRSSTSDKKKKNANTTGMSREENGNNRKYYKKSPMSLPGDTYRPVHNPFDTDTVRVHRNINETRSCLAASEKRWAQGVKRKESASTPDDVIEEAPLQSEIAA